MDANVKAQAETFLYTCHIGPRHTQRDTMKVCPFCDTGMTLVVPPAFLSRYERLLHSLTVKPCTMYAWKEGSCGKGPQL